MSDEARPPAKDMRLAGENYCIDCPDPEACHQGAPCDIVRVTAEALMEGTRADFVIIDEANRLPDPDGKTDEERLNRTNNVWVIDDPRGARMPTSDQSKPKLKEPKETEAPESQYDHDESAGEKLVEEVRSLDVKMRTWLSEVQPEKILAYGVLIAAMFGLGRRKTPKRRRVDYHLYVHTEKEKDKNKK